MHYDLTDLRLFVHVGELLNLTRAAEKSFLSVPSASLRVKQLEESLPSTKGTFSINHQREVLYANLRVNYFGSYFEDHLDDGGLPIDGESAVTVDLEFGAKFTSGLYFAVGAQNAFDKEPQDNPYAGIAGSQFPVHAPYGINGGFYYARVGYKF